MRPDVFLGFLGQEIKKGIDRNLHPPKPQRQQPPSLECRIFGVFLMVLGGLICYGWRGDGLWALWLIFIGLLFFLPD